MKWVDQRNAHLVVGVPALELFLPYHHPEREAEQQSSVARVAEHDGEEERERDDRERSCNTTNSNVPMHSRQNIMNDSTREVPMKAAYVLKKWLLSDVDN